MNGRASTILTALVVAALIAVGVAYLIANPATRDDRDVPGADQGSGRVAIISPPVQDAGTITGQDGRLEDTASPTPVITLTPEEQGFPGTVEGVETTAPTGPAEWVLAGMLGIVVIGGWNLIRLQRAA